MPPFLPPTVPFHLNLLAAARLMPLFARRASLADTLAIATPAAGLRGYENLTPGEMVAAILAVTRRPWAMRDRRCLRQGLLAFHFLSLAGREPVLHFGVAPSSMRTAKPRAHCWVSVAGITILNAPAEPMTEIFRHEGVGPIANDRRFRAVAWT